MSIFWPFALTSIPFSYLGGRIVLAGSLYKSMVGVVLLYAAFRLFRSASQGSALAEKHRMPVWAALGAGAGIDLLSRLIGLGGGIFLTLLLLFNGWSEPRQAASLSAAYNLVNSLAGLLGQVTSLVVIPAAIIPWAIDAGIGGWIGAGYGSQSLGNARLQQVLAIIMIIAGLKIVFFRVE